MSRPNTLTNTSSNSNTNKQSILQILIKQQKQLKKKLTPTTQQLPDNPKSTSSSKFIGYNQAISNTKTRQSKKDKQKRNYPEIRFTLNNQLQIDNKIIQIPIKISSENASAPSPLLSPGQSVQSQIDRCYQMLNFIKQQNDIIFTYEQQQNKQMHSLRNQISKNKLMKAKLIVQKNKLKLQVERQIKVLDRLLDEVEKTQRNAAANQNPYTNPKNRFLQYESNQYIQQQLPSLQSLIAQIPEQYHKNFTPQQLGIQQSSDATLSALTFLTSLTSLLIKSDSQIHTLEQKLLAQQQTAQNLSSQLQVLQRSKQSMIESLRISTDNLQAQQNLLSRLQIQYSKINQPGYVESQVNQRVVQQINFIEAQCNRLRNNLRKLNKLIKVSGNPQAISQASHAIQELGDYYTEDPNP